VKLRQLLHPYSVLPKKGRRHTKPRLSMIFENDGIVDVLMPDFQSGTDVSMHRNVPTKKITLNGKAVLVATVFDLQLAQYGIDRGLGGEIAKGY
jgi:nitrate reductase alpha subunit